MLLFGASYKISNFLITQGLRIKIIMSELDISIAMFNPLILNRVCSRRQIEQNLPLPRYSSL